MIIGALAHIWLTVGPLGPRSHLVAISLTLRCIIGVDTHGSWPNPVLVPGPLVRTTAVGEDQVETFETPAPSPGSK